MRKWRNRIELTLLSLMRGIRMPRVQKVWDPEFEPIRPPVSDKLFAKFEKKYDLQLPESFKSLYRIQNGGAVQDVDEFSELLPIDDAMEIDFAFISPIGSLFEADDIEWIGEE